MSKKKYPKIVSKNKALCKAVSLIPTTPMVSVPVAYVRALPMIVGAITIVTILVLPVTRNFLINFSSNSSEQFSTRTQVLKNQMALSLNTGVSAYIGQISGKINILPIDSDLDSKNYLGRVEVGHLKQIETRSVSERAHFMTASIFGGFDYIR